MKALIIEDDPEIVESISLALKIRWPDTQIVSTHLGRKGIELTETEEPDVVILDLGLPDISGFEVLKEIRFFSTVPVIILTVKGDEGDIVKGLEWGADDYIVKPCGQLELLARVQARIRDKTRYSDNSLLSYGSLRFNPATRQLLNRGSETNLTAIEAQIIHRLVRNSGMVVTYLDLSEEVWGEEYPGSVDSLRVHIRRLREKIEENPGQPRIILTKSGLGYYLGKPGSF